MQSTVFREPCLGRVSKILTLNLAQNAKFRMGHPRNRWGIRSDAPDKGPGRLYCFDTQGDCAIFLAHNSGLLAGGIYDA